MAAANTELVWRRKEWQRTILERSKAEQVRGWLAGPLRRLCSSEVVARVLPSQDSILYRYPKCVTLKDI